MAATPDLPVRARATGRNDSRKALASGADAVVLDLEDAVAADAKADARAAVHAWAATADPSDRARASCGSTTPRHRSTRRTCRWSPKPGCTAVMLPKAETVEQVAAVRAAAPAAGAGPDRDRTRRRAAGEIAAADGVDPAGVRHPGLRAGPGPRHRATHRTGCATPRAGWPSPPACAGLPAGRRGHPPAGRPRPGCWPTSRGRAGTASAPSCASTRPRSSRSTPRWPRTPRPSRGRAGCWTPTARHPERPGSTAA